MWGCLSVCVSLRAGDQAIVIIATADVAAPAQGAESECKRACVYETEGCCRFLDTSFKPIEIDDNPQSESFIHDGEGNDDDGVTREAAAAEPRNVNEQQSTATVHG